MPKKIINLCLRDINPYLRFVLHTKYAPVNSLFCAVDYHFYYFWSDCIMEIAGQEHSIKSGEVVIIPPGTEYGFMNTEIIDVLLINFDFTQNHTDLTEGIIPIPVNEFLQSRIVEKVNFIDNDLLNNCIVMAGKNRDFIMESLEEITEEYKYKKQYYAETASCVFKKVLLTVARRGISGESSDSDIDKILSYIHSHYREYIDNSTLAEMVGYHPYHLNRMMKKITGTTLRQYVIDYRINAAKKYLRESEYRISEISEMCGYKNFTNFSRDFKNKCGMTPGHYREEVRHIL